MDAFRASSGGRGRPWTALAARNGFTAAAAPAESRRMSERDYILGTDDDEVERLGLQHRVWRPQMLDAFRRAGIGPGAHVVDVGAGPGFASADLAEIVGPAGQVLALERSRRFLDALDARARRLGLANIEAREQDVAE